MNKKTLLKSTLCALVLATTTPSVINAQRDNSSDIKPVARAGLAMSTSFTSVASADIRLDDGKKKPEHFSLYTGVGLFFTGFTGTPYRNDSKEVPIIEGSPITFTYRSNVVPLIQWSIYASNCNYAFGGGITYANKTSTISISTFKTFQNSTANLSPFINAGLNLKSIFKKMKNSWFLKAGVNYIPSDKDLPKDFKNLDGNYFRMNVGIDYVFKQNNSYR